MTAESDALGSEPHDTGVRIRELRWALAGGAFTAAGIFGVTMLVGQVSSFEARRLVAGIKPTATFAASTYIAAGATILALMSTVIAFSITHDSEFRHSHYRRLRRIAAATTALILVAIALMTCLVVPIAEADSGSTGYVVLYWTVLALSSLGGGLAAMIVLMLNYSVRGLVDLGTHGRSFLTVQDETDQDEIEQAGTDDGTDHDRASSR